MKITFRSGSWVSPPFLFSLLLLQAGCTTRSGYRPVTDVPAVSVSQHAEHVCDFQTYRPCNKPPEREHASLEKYSKDNFWLGHVELSEYGTYQDNSPYQISVIERAVEQDTHARNSLFKNGITIVVYVHGWFNNAQEENGNLKSFRQMLHDVAAEQRNQNRGVLGVYLSWRGESVTVPVLKYLTYWGRGRTADVIGQGMVEPLSRIRNIHWLVATSGGGSGGSTFDSGIYQNSRLIFIGHSFGGRALYTAVGKSMEAAFMPPYWAARTFLAAKGKGTLAEATMPRVTGLGDLVLLINPAIKSLPYRPVHYAMHSNATVNYDGFQPVLMMVLSAKNDVPNKRLLPIGETLGNRFRDRFARPEDQKPARQNTSALGHWAPYHTHDLQLTTDGQLYLRKVEAYFTADARGHEQVLPPNLPIKTLRPGVMNFKDRNGRSLICLDDESNPGLLPFMVVSTSKDIIDGHSGFWPPTKKAGQTTPTKGPRAFDFVKCFISAQNKGLGTVREEQAPTAAAHNLPKNYSKAEGRKLKDKK